MTKLALDKALTTLAGNGSRENINRTEKGQASGRK
jgi:hypothetical protein